MSFGPTAKPNAQVTGYILPGMAKTGQLSRKAESLSDSKVADITTTFRGKVRPLVAFDGLEKTFFSKPRRISCDTCKHTACALNVREKEQLLAWHDGKLITHVY